MFISDVLGEVSMNAISNLACRMGAHTFASVAMDTGRCRCYTKSQVNCLTKNLKKVGRGGAEGVNQASLF